jgi:hypothetical protein
MELSKIDKIRSREEVMYTMAVYGTKVNLFMQMREDITTLLNHIESKDNISQRSELYFAFMEEYNALMGKSEHQILKEEVVVLLAKYRD